MTGWRLWAGRERAARPGKVVNFKRYGAVAALDQAFGKRWLYIGRANRAAGFAQSPLANPFRASHYGGRGRTLPHYRNWLWGRILSGDERIINALRAITEDTVLVWYCKPVAVPRRRGPGRGRLVAPGQGHERRILGKITGPTSLAKDG
jgi:Domain of unknown function (DUF4326)